MSAPSLIQEVKKRSAWNIVMGIVTAALGVFLIAYPMATATITVVLLGWILVFVGVAQLVFALYAQTPGKFFLKVLSSLVNVACGIALVAFPITGVAILTGVLATMLLIQTGLEIATAVQLRPLDGWGWFLADGAASLLLGGLILAKWPSTSVWVIGTLVGAYVLMHGICRTIIATKVRTEASNVQRFARAV